MKAEWEVSKFSLLYPAVAVFQSNDVIFPEIIPDLDFDELHQFLALVGQGVFFLQRNVNRLVDLNLFDIFTHGDRGYALHHRPMF